MPDSNYPCWNSLRGNVAIIGLASFFLGGGKVLWPSSRGEEGCELVGETKRAAQRRASNTTVSKSTASQYEVVRMCSGYERQVVTT